MVLPQLIGLCASTTRVFGRSLSSAIQQAVAINAPNGTFLQKLGGALFGIESATQMLPTEARLVLGFDPNQRITTETVQAQYRAMALLNDPRQGGSDYLGERFLVAAHILLRSGL
jgi:hypothetical protein